MTLLPCEVKYSTFFACKFSLNEEVYTGPFIICFDEKFHFINSKPLTLKLNPKSVEIFGNDNLIAN